LHWNGATWVVGASSIFGYGIILSDVRATFPDKSQADLVKKAYPLGRYIIGGFSGSIKIGFNLLDSLRSSLQPPPNADPSGAWNPSIVANSWGPECAAPAFAASEEAEKRLCCTILLLGLSQGRELSERRREVTRVHIIRLSSPDFRPGYMRRWFTVCHIGRGSKVKLYKEMMDSFFHIRSSAIQAEQGGPSLWATVLASSMGQLAETHPTAGISPHVHALVCRPPNMIELVNDRTTVSAEGVRTEFKMPTVATTYEEFRAICSKQGRAAEAAGA
jgi:hypothetical protein